MSLPLRALLLPLVIALAAPAAGAAIRVPPGVGVRTVATGVGSPTNIAFDPAGGIWVTSGAGDPGRDGVWYVRRPGARPVHAVRGLHHALGLTWHRGELYVSSVKGDRGRVLAYGGFDGRRFARVRTVLRDLVVGLHEVDTLVPGPDGRLYVGIGSTTNAGVRGRFSGVVASFRPSGRGLRVEGRGFRNPYGLAFIPGTRLLVVSDNGRDDLGPRRPPDELNLIATAGPPRSFGFPRCHDQGGPACRGARAPLARLAPHAAAGGVAVARRWGRAGTVAFVAENGSNVGPRTGSDVVQVGLRRVRGRWRARRARPFARGFRRHDPLGAAIGPDGALYVTLWQSGKVVRFTPPR